MRPRRSGLRTPPGVIHRDLKPDNVYLVRNGDQEFVKLLDFGVAKVTGGKRLTRIGMVFGTPHYMSPEQAEGKRIDARADIYALGVLMYECFVGRVPFEADTYMGVLTKHMYMSPEPLEQVMPDATTLGAFGPIVMRCSPRTPRSASPRWPTSSRPSSLALDPPGRGVSVAPPGELPRHESIRPRAPRVDPAASARVDTAARTRRCSARSRRPRSRPSRLSMAARGDLALAAVLRRRHAIALGVRALRVSAPEGPPRRARGCRRRSAAALLQAETAPARAIDEPPAVATAAATAAPAPARAGAARYPGAQPSGDPRQADRGDGPPGGDHGAHGLDGKARKQPAISSIPGSADRAGRRATNPGFPAVLCTMDDVERRARGRGTSDRRQRRRSGGALDSCPFGLAILRQARKPLVAKQQLLLVDADPRSAESSRSA